MSSDESTTVDPSSMKVMQLREELKKRNLSTAGNKTALVQRLQESFKGAGDVEATNGDEDEKEDAAVDVAADEVKDEAADSAESEEEPAAEEPELEQQQVEGKEVTDETEVVDEQTVIETTVGLPEAEGGY